MVLFSKETTCRAKKTKKKYCTHTQFQFKQRDRQHFQATMSALRKKQFLLNNRKCKQLETDSSDSSTKAESIGSERTVIAASEGPDAAASFKKVHFNDDVKTISSSYGKSLDKRTLQRYRNDAWYTVRAYSGCLLS